MTVFRYILMCMVGVVSMFLAFYATGIRGAFSHGPSQPISKAGRVIFFLAGMAAFVDGFNRLVSRFGAPHVWWPSAVPLVVVAIFALVLNSKRVRACMGRVVTSKPTVAIKFAGHLPSGLVALRIAFFVIVALMALFGFGPIAFSIAKMGIIACVLALFAVGVLYDVFEHHYLRTGQTTEVKLADEDQG